MPSDREKPLPRKGGSRLVSAAFSSLLLLLSSCDSQPADATPSGALAGFLQALERSAHDPAALREAYGLLDRRARAALRARASKTETLAGGRRFKPWEMLAQGRFQLRFTPARRDAMQERIDGDRAVVVVRGESARKRAEGQMVREAEGWRVVLDVPEMPSSAATDAGSDGS